MHNSLHFRRLRRWWRRDDGSNVLEFVILMPAFILILGLCVAGGTVAFAHQKMEHVAEEVARAASVARTPAAAVDAANTRAAEAFQAKGLRCQTSNVQVDTSQFFLPPGIPAAVSVTVRCVVVLDVLGYVGINGSRDISATATSPVDTYRERLR